MMVDELRVPRPRRRDSVGFVTRPSHVIAVAAKVGE
jgi:hypothetical protein